MQFAQGCPELVQRAAFESVPGDQKLAEDGAGTRAGANGLEWLPFDEGQQFFRPGAFPSAVGGKEWLEWDSYLGQDGTPSAVGTSLGPGSSAEREDCSFGCVLDCSGGSVELQVDTTLEAQGAQAVSHGESDSKAA
jgi:hypothetical protein